MPPRAKFTKEEIINAGLEILKEKDLSSVTAREIGKRLKSSSRPIFTTFQNMNEVMEGIKDKAREIYTGYVQQGLKETIAFRGVGQAYIMFAIKEPKLFQLLFNNEVVWIVFTTCWVNAFVFFSVYRIDVVFNFIPAFKTFNEIGIVRSF